MTRTLKKLMRWREANSAETSARLDALLAKQRKARRERRKAEGWQMAKLIAKTKALPGRKPRKQDALQASRDRGARLLARVKAERERREGLK